MLLWMQWTMQSMILKHVTAMRHASMQAVMNSQLALLTACRVASTNTQGKSTTLMSVMMIVMMTILRADALTLPKSVGCNNNICHALILLKNATLSKLCSKGADAFLRFVTASCLYTACLCFGNAVIGKFWWLPLGNDTLAQPQDVLYIKADQKQWWRYLCLIISCAKACCSQLGRMRQHDWRYRQELLHIKADQEQCWRHLLQHQLCQGLFGQHG